MMSVTPQTNGTAEPAIDALVAAGHGATRLGPWLHWLRSLLSWQVQVTRWHFGALADDEYRGLYVPYAEAELVATGLPALPDELLAWRDELAAERAALAARAEPSDTLTLLAAHFGLDAFAQDIVLLALAPELDLRLERLIAFIQDDISKRRPTADLALRLLCRSPEEWAAAREALAPGGPLLRNRLIQLVEEGQRHQPLPARLIKLDDRVVAALLGEALIDPPLQPFVSLGRPTRQMQSLNLPADLVEQVRWAWTQGAGGLTLALQGGYGSGRLALAEALCAEEGRPLLRVNLARAINSAAGLDPVEVMARIGREAILQGAAIFWQGAEPLLHEPVPGAENLSAWREALLEALATPCARSCLAIEQQWEARGSLPNYVRVELTALSYSQREQLWRQRLGAAAPDAATIHAVASTFRLSGGQIRDAATMARSLSGWRRRSHAESVEPQDLYAACRTQSSGRLDTLAHKIRTTYSWDDIVLPPDQISQLREVCIQIRHRRIVLEEWGFDRHLAMGKGVNVLFAGPSGTGKTMAAEIVAADLGLELYKIDLSTMVSKYIGETEKNLDKVFTAAREANAILFFDEADAIFGKRSEVKDAHDRYANIEVGYLLQKMEEYDGVVILATNLRKNLDDAFARRLHVAIDFPFPEEADRLRIWRKVFPAAAPLAADVDLRFLARRFRLTGGNLRNVALLAAYLAAEDGTAIGMGQIVRAVKREHQKTGKLTTEADFGPYLALVRG